MKALVFLVIAALVGVYGTGRVNLGESGSMRFLSKMEALMREGKSEEVCAMFHDDLEVEIEDHSGESVHHVSGGKKEFCELTTETIDGFGLLPHSMRVDYTDVEAVLTLGKPWTSEVTYSEHRALSIFGANVTLRTVSNDAITLVQTFSGVKLTRLKSQLYKADAT